MKPVCELFITMLAGVQLASAASISIDFNNTTDINWVISGTEIAGPTVTAYWNTTSTANGADQPLHDDSNDPTGAAIAWASSDYWINGDGNGTLDRQLAHAYLDDGNGGVSITVTNVPYLQYRVYLLLASDQNGNNATYTTRDFNVNGTWILNDLINGDGTQDTTTAIAHGGMGSSGDSWIEILGNGSGSQTQTGNYMTFDTSGSTLTILGLNRSVNDRGSIAGIIIEEIVGVPEPSSVALLGIGGLALALRRRRK